MKTSRGIDAHRLTLVAVEVDKKLRRVGAEDGKHVGHVGVFLAERDDFLRLFLQILQIALTAAILDDELEAARRAEARHRRRAKNCHGRFGNLLMDFFTKHGGNSITVQRRIVAFIEAVQRDKKVAEVGAVGAERERLASHGYGVQDAARLAPRSR